MADPNAVAAAFITHFNTIFDSADRTQLAPLYVRPLLPRAHPIPSDLACGRLRSKRHPCCRMKAPCCRGRPQLSTTTPTRYGGSHQTYLPIAADCVAPSRTAGVRVWNLALPDADGGDHHRCAAAAAVGWPRVLCYGQHHRALPRPQWTWAQPHAADDDCASCCCCACRLRARSTSRSTATYFICFQSTAATGCRTRCSGYTSGRQSAMA